MQVWEVIERPSNEKVIPTRWVDVNKGDEKNVKYRSRLVAKEIKRFNGTPGSWTDFFASMPPITALRILFTLAVTKKVPDLKGKLVDMSDKACMIFFWSPARRRLLVELPPEAGCSHDKVGFLKKSLEMRPPIGRRLSRRSCLKSKIQFLLILPWGSSHWSRSSRRRFYSSGSEE